MDGLLDMINAKRKGFDRDPGPSGSSSNSEPPRKYMRRGEIEAMEEEEKRRKQAEAEEKRERLKAESRAIKMRKEAEQAKKDAIARMASSGANTPEPSSSTNEGFNISPEECVRRLRSKGHPIRLFGETDKDRKLRLRALELLEARGEGGQNEFKRTLEGMENSMEEKKLTEMAKMLHAKAVAEKERAEKAEKAETVDAVEQRGEDVKDSGNKAKERVDTGVLDLGLVREDPKKLYPLIYYALKNVLKEWEESMDARPEEVKQSGQGKMAAATQVQSAQNLKPLFRQLRSRDMPPDVLRNMAEIVHYMQTRHYQKANDAYLRLSIGTAAWPIGVTSVGIHERSSQDKLYVDKVAHVLNDEVSRKWIQAVKRLLTFSQNVRPPKEIAHMMG